MAVLYSYYTVYCISCRRYDKTTIARLRLYYLSFVIITIPTIVVAFISRSLTITVVTGIVLMAGLRLFF